MSKTDMEQQLKEIQQQLMVLNGRLEKSGVFSDGEEVGSGGFAAFERRMNLFVIAMNGFFALSTWAFYMYMPAFFPISFGLLFVFLILAVGLAIDEYLLPTHTFRRISTNALAVSVFWFSVMFLAVSGVRIGMSIISDPFGGEEGRRSKPPAVESASATGETPDSALYGPQKTSVEATKAPATENTTPSSTNAPVQGSSGDSDREQ